MKYRKHAEFEYFVDAVECFKHLVICTSFEVKMETRRERFRYIIYKGKRTKS